MEFLTNSSTKELFTSEVHSQKNVIHLPSAGVTLKLAQINLNISQFKMVKSALQIQKEVH